MQNSFSSQNYKYAGKTYTFMAYVHIGLVENSTAGNYLNNEDILSFQYTNELNSLYLKGEMIYVDKYSIMDKFFQEQSVYCTITNVQHEYENDNLFKTTKLSDTLKFYHTFIIDKLQIIERSGNTLTYKMSLVGKNWYNCTANLNYSTYNTKKTDIFDILKSLIVQSGQVCEPLTSDKIKSGVEIDYITHENDNLLTCFKYLMNKMLYYRTFSESIKFLLYNETTNMYQFFDLIDQELTNGVTTITISMFKSNAEMQFQEQPVNVGSVVKNSQRDIFENIKRNLISEYDYNMNTFNINDVKSKTIVNYLNSRSVSLEDYDNKFYDITSELEYTKHGSYWNNETDYYEETFKILNNGNALVVTVDGNIITKPGAFIFINVDRDDPGFTQSEEIQDLENTKQKYRNLEGFWIVGKVRTIISVSGGVFRQNLVLFKNFKLKEKEES